MRTPLALSLALISGCGGGSPSSPASRHPISPYIYGTSQGDWAGRSRRLRLGRLGGNRWTAYNWETNASNAGADGWGEPRHR